MNIAGSEVVLERCCERVGEKFCWDVMVMLEKFCWSVVGMLWECFGSVWRYFGKLKIEFM